MANTFKGTSIVWMAVLVAWTVAGLGPALADSGKVLMLRPGNGGKGGGPDF